jgi:uncharacterized SAM-binding protein YcdF (DUF218 family)
MGFFRWLFSLAVLSVWCALVGTVLYVALYEPDEQTPSGDAIVVLGGDTTDSGGLNNQTSERVTAAIGLFKDNAAPLMVMTGGNGVGEAMRDMAVGAGVPALSIVVEGDSKSTLQNALFTADLLRVNTDDTLLLVSQKYHLPRAYASFRWAGFTDVINVAANAETDFLLSRELVWESVKWPFNALRAAAASAANAGNVPRENYIKYLE